MKRHPLLTLVQQSELLQPDPSYLVVEGLLSLLRCSQGMSGEPHLSNIKHLSDDGCMST